MPKTFTSYLIGFLVILALVLVTLLLYVAFDSYRSGNQELFVDSAVGVIAIIAAVVAGWRASLLQERLQHDREEARRSASRLEKQRLDERFAEAVQHLSSEKTETQIGGLLALDRMLHSTPSVEERWQITQMVEFYIRRKCLMDSMQDPIPLPEHVQVAVQVICKRPLSKEPRPLNLSNLALCSLRAPSPANLASADFSGSDLSNSIIRMACLTNSNFEDTNLSGAQMDGADLSKSNLTSANLTRTRLSSARLTQAKLDSALLTGTDFENAQLEDASLTSSTLSEVAFRSAHLAHVDFSSTESITRTDFTGARMAGASMRVTDISNVGLSSRQKAEVDHLP
ncbi:pentapeptide repeat-containing protein [Plesiocystis pacifica]|uniref:pentapeptide repeat-containing protein n=1 Tax=Plesiocystis pacifica TaxID=191768 RepID=UPI000A30510F|nr:pentapeptide repeat-containing protein [Plesiocystis pacifica]